MTQQLEQLLIPDIAKIVFQYYSDIFIKPKQSLTFWEDVTYYYLCGPDRACNPFSAQGRHLLVAIDRADLVDPAVYDINLSETALTSPVWNINSLRALWKRLADKPSNKMLRAATLCSTDCGAKKIKWLARRGVTRHEDALANVAEYSDSFAGFVRKATLLIKNRNPMGHTVLAAAGRCMYDDGLDRMKWIYDAKITRRVTHTVVADTISCCHPQSVERLRWLATEPGIHLQLDIDDFICRAILSAYSTLKLAILCEYFVRTRYTHAQIATIRNHADGLLDSDARRETIKILREYRLYPRAEGPH